MSDTKTNSTHEDEMLSKSINESINSQEKVTISFENINSEIDLINNLELEGK